MSNELMFSKQIIDKTIFCKINWITCMWMMQMWNSVHSAVKHFFFSWNLRCLGINPIGTLSENQTKERNKRAFQEVKIKVKPNIKTNKIEIRIQFSDLIYEPLTELTKKFIKVASAIFIKTKKSRRKRKTNIRRCLKREAFKYIISSSQRIISIIFNGSNSMKNKLRTKLS